MTRTIGIFLSALLFVSACATGGPQVAGSDGPQSYSLNGVQPSRIRSRMLDGINALRQNGGLAPLRIDNALNTAAGSHSRDMVAQQRAWHFGSDGSSPVTRVQTAGYGKELVGENISESYETELETLTAWMTEPETRDVIMSPVAEDIGLGWFQESNGKIWWTLVIGGGALRTPPTYVPPANTAPPGAPPTVPVATDDAVGPAETSDAGTGTESTSG